MQLQISLSLRHVTLLPTKGLREFIRVKVGTARRLRSRMFFYAVLFFTFLLRFVFVLTAVDTIDGENKCSTIASNSIPKQLHCLELRLADEHTNNAAARLPLPSAELVPTTTSILSYSQTMSSAPLSSRLHSSKIVCGLRNLFYTSSQIKRLFPSLNKVVFLDDDIVVQTDLTPLWDIDMKGKINGAVETCNGGDHNKLVMSKRFKNYLNFSHPLISNNFDPNQCAWAYGMNIFDLEAWRKTNISFTYHYWIEQV
ncbi:hypothetical protein PIB30_084627 [Stylosanthes scabra]|uniref:Hexosyltransferase n=1 Tax=Stylosanthes scabra TaxID=79078 RepID=A0ABU6XQT3_9FABA|nr:hypothetical protein [Stylosanthes scabra]